ncbi:hypothetical protein EVAR_101272_1 [Eumeta japonica]|uniref:Uncharacterized protein n=1 Tax=Eumeta variegata TaxID=151549 RepID=A0A4C1T515_EUMVA|nr:hypothetical protein EVAR_101272_1 [Eumeta japonica]
MRKTRAVHACRRGAAARADIGHGAVTGDGRLLVPWRIEECLIKGHAPPDDIRWKVRGRGEERTEASPLKRDVINQPPVMTSPGRDNVQPETLSRQKHDSCVTAACTKNMTHAALPRSEAFHLRLEVRERRTSDKEAQSASAFGSVRHLSLSYLSERCVRVDCCYTIIHLHVFVKYEVQ